jgi:hypothetical protein
MTATWAKVSAEWEQVEARWLRAEHVRERWLSHAAQHEERQYSSSAVMQARLTSMPVIEQAKGILMAECGFTADQASDALRRASLSYQMRVQDLAATIVARTAAADMAAMDQRKPKLGRGRSAATDPRRVAWQLTVGARGLLASRASAARARRQPRPAIHECRPGNPRGENPSTWRLGTWRRRHLSLQGHSDQSKPG